MRRGCRSVARWRGIRTPELVGSDERKNCWVVDDRVTSLLQNGNAVNLVIARRKDASRRCFTSNRQGAAGAQKADCRRAHPVFKAGRIHQCGGLEYSRIREGT